MLQGEGRGEGSRSHGVRRHLAWRRCPALGQPRRICRRRWCAEIAGNMQLRGGTADAFDAHRGTL